MIMLRTLLAAALVLFALPAFAQEAAYPVGSRLGLVPPKGMVPSQAFQGFEDREKEVAVIIGTLPPEAYADLEKSLTAEALKAEGIIQEKREQIATPFGKAVMISGRQQIDGKNVRKWVMVASGKEFTGLVTAQIPDAAAQNYPDTAIRTALVSLTVRDKVPDAEHLSMLPFSLETLSDFRIAAVVPGRAILLSDATGEKDVPNAAHFVITVGPETPGQNEDRDVFARKIFGGVSNIKDVMVQSSEPLRIGGQQGHQILADAKDAKTNSNLKMVQWLRLGGGGHMQMIGTAQASSWTAAFNRFRAVRDGIQPK